MNEKCTIYMVYIYCSTYIYVHTYVHTSIPDCQKQLLADVDIITVFYIQHLSQKVIVCLQSHIKIYFFIFLMHLKGGMRIFVLSM